MRGAASHGQDGLIGRTINNYEVKALIGEGGMGSVYVAEHPVIGRKAAIKILMRSLVSDQTMVTRFINEARAANAIRHPNIIEILDVGQLPDGQPYLMMEFLEGETLATRLNRVVRIPLQAALGIADQAASALGTAHEAGIVHRDLKPDNLFLVPDPEMLSQERVKVLDFGIAKLRPGLSDRVSRTTGTILGTPLYMSPEQCRGLNAEVDARTDVYAFGALLYHMLCGVPPFVATSQMDLLMMHIQQPPRPPRTINPEIPEAIEAIILRALAKQAAQRYASMAALRAALHSVPGISYGAVTTGRRQLTVDLPEPEDTAAAMAASSAAAKRKRVLVGGGAAAIILAILAVVIVGRTGATRTDPVPVVAPATTAREPVAAPAAVPTPAPPPPSPSEARPAVVAPERPRAARKPTAKTPATKLARPAAIDDDDVLDRRH